MSTVAEAKQTDTTQRWKIHLRRTDSATDLPTRIEFSRRRFDPGTVFEPIDSELAQTYKIRPVIVSHYDIEAAFAQKLAALIGRSQTQARDIFDLAHLKERGATGSNVDRRERKSLGVAVENAMSVSLDEFTGQVVAYMARDYQEFYGKRGAWQQLQEKVVKTIEEL